MVNSASTGDSAERARSVAPGRVRVMRNDHDEGVRWANVMILRINDMMRQRALDPAKVAGPRRIARRA